MIREPLPLAMPHGPLREVLPDVFLVTGTMRVEIAGVCWQFSRNMIVLREVCDLILINTVRLDDEGLSALDALGRVRHILRLGDMHGLDDAFYAARYASAAHWGLPDMTPRLGLSPSKNLRKAMPVDGASLFEFQTSKRPECILRLDRGGGIALACDSLQNWDEPDAFFNEGSTGLMRELGFFSSANCGVVWRHISDPKAEDFVRLKELPFEHALCGHGAPLLGGASTFFHASFAKLFGV